MRLIRGHGVVHVVRLNHVNCVRVLLQSIYGLGQLILNFYPIMKKNNLVEFVYTGIHTLVTKVRMKQVCR